MVEHLHKCKRVNIISPISDILTALIRIYVRTSYWIGHRGHHVIVQNSSPEMTLNSPETIISRLIRQCMRDRGLYVNITRGQFQALLTTARQLLCNLDMHQTLRGGGMAAFRCFPDLRPCRVVYEGYQNTTRTPICRLFLRITTLSNRAEVFFEAHMSQCLFLNL